MLSFTSSTNSTDLVIEEIFNYVLEMNSVFTSKLSYKEKCLLSQIKVMINDFHITYEKDLKILCLQLCEIDDSNVRIALAKITSHFFTDGITWTRILFYFVFIKELCTCQKLSNFVVHECVSDLVKAKLGFWMHNNWSYISVVKLEPYFFIRNIWCGYVIAKKTIEDNNFLTAISICSTSSGYPLSDLTEMLQNVKVTPL